MESAAHINNPNFECPNEAIEENKDAEHVESHIKVGEFVKSAVYGGLDGVITTFMIALSGFGGGTTMNVIVAIGVSSLIVDALSMAIADFVATKRDSEYM